MCFYYLRIKECMGTRIRKHICPICFCFLPLAHHLTKWRYDMWSTTTQSNADDQLKRHKQTVGYLLLPAWLPLRSSSSSSRRRRRCRSSSNSRNSHPAAGTATSLMQRQLSLGVGRCSCPALTPNDRPAKVLGWTIELCTLLLYCGVAWRGDYPSLVPLTNFTMQWLTAVAQTSKYT